MSNIDKDAPAWEQIMGLSWIMLDDDWISTQ
jgi:hypothetical protein